ncbi:MAG: hypothetical protein K9M49_08510 [Candidatus Marinimicrobia bacterium]|nr:hypothetical protein [Candidatus Neomarinimicrobiota bacterium]MCF7850898.1 hypothetical protein [Candidatus Neomarinimicrobiota bacterium]MCF7905178.1 hypothetical protein [Candidatus Neomarinimicrobiota bacterium]
MLVAVIMSFLVLSFTGVAVLEVANTSRTVSNQTIQNIKLQFALETAVNEALWRINCGVDSLVNLDENGVLCVWDSTDLVLTVSVNDGKYESEVELDLSDDTHFDHSLASSNFIEFNGYDAGLTKQKQSRVFTFLPQADYEYFETHSVETHNGNYNSWKEDFLAQEGIHIFTGNNLLLTDINITNSTLVFTGKNIFFSGSNTLTAPAPLDSASALPALVFTNPDANLHLASGDHIEGAIFCAGEISIEGSTLTGPIVGKTISLHADLNLLETEYSQFYGWALGFGAVDEYDWPKQIGRWTSTTWGTVENS